METIDIASLPIKENDWLLDLGCGEGRHSIACCFHHPNANVIGLDLSFSSLKTAKEKHTDFFENEQISRYVNSSGFDLPFSGSSFDHVICSEVLEHIESYELFLNEIRRVLKPNGQLSISVPRKWPEKICWLLSNEYHQIKGGHVRIFNTDALQNEIVERDFTFLEKYWAHALHSPYWWLRCLWWRDGNENVLSALYHRVLVWDLLKRPRFTQLAEKWLNPFMGKSTVMHFKKNA